MKKKITNNLGMKLLSILAAVIIWLIIVNVEDAMTTREITIPVEPINTNAVTDENYMFEPVSGEQATITVRARSSVIYNLTASDFKATADLSLLSITDAVFVEVEQTRESIQRDGVVEIIENNNTYKIQIEPSETKTFTLTPVKVGEEAEGYYVSAYQPTPNRIQITGATSRINNIKEVVLEVDVDGASSDFTSQVTPKIYDFNGDLMDTENLQMDIEGEVSVNVTVLPTKMVKVNFTTTGVPAEGYEVTNVEALPEEVLVAGTEEALEDLTEINMSLDISGAKETIVQNLSYDEVLSAIDESLQVVASDDTVGLAVTVTIEEEEHTTVALAFDQIQLNNADTEYDYELASDLTTIPIDVTGAASVINDFKAADLDVSTDVAGLGVGTHTVFLNITSSKAVTLPRAPAINIRILERN